MLRRNLGAIIIFLIIVILFAAAGYVAWRATEQARLTNGDRVENGTNQDITDWNTFESEQFAFQLQYPPAWNVATTSTIVPVINVYNPDTVSTSTLQDTEPPFIHHNNLTQVSIFPHGFPTEGVLGQRAVMETREVFPAGVDREVTYTLQDDTIWAWFITPQNPPQNWQEPGFIWAAARINNHDTICVRNGEEVSEDACDPLTSDDEIIHTGSVDQNDITTVRQILQTFTFTNERQ